MRTYNVITLCGSARFESDFLRLQKALTLQGNIVISLGMFGRSEDDEPWPPSTKEMLGDLHKGKIDLANEIFVVNKDGYIGESTESEIAYANATGKKVRYLEPLL